MDKQTSELLLKLTKEIRNKRYGDPDIRRRNQWRNLCLRKGRKRVSGARNQSTPGCFMWDIDGDSGEGISDI